MNRALNPPPRLAAWRSYAGILLRRRPGVDGGRPLPHMTRRTRDVCIDADWLERYRDLIGLATPQPVLPPLALQVAAAPLHLSILADARFPFRAAGLVPVGQRIEQITRLPVRGVYRLESHTAGLRTVRQGSRFDIVTEARMEGRLVWRSTVVTLSRHDSEATESAYAPLSTLMPAGEPEVWSQVETVRLREDLGRRCSAVMGDWYRLQPQTWLARPLGLARVVLPGTWTLARALAAAGWPRHDAFSLRAQFRKAVRPPGTISIWTQASPSVQNLRVTDEDGGVEHLVASIEPAIVLREPVRPRAHGWR